MNNLQINKCIDCGKEISKLPKRCKSCSNKFRKGKYNKKGYKMEKSPHWRGGIGIYRRLLEKKKCEKCGNKKRLIIHHKDGNRRNNKLDNLCVLCVFCHAKVHNILKNIYNNEFCLFCGRVLNNKNRNYCPKEDDKGCYEERARPKQRGASKRSYQKHKIKTRKRTKSFYDKNRERLNKRRRELYAQKNGRRTK